MSLTSMADERPILINKVLDQFPPPNVNEEMIYEIPCGEETCFSRNCEGIEVKSYPYASWKHEVKGELVKTIYVPEDGDIWIYNPKANRRLDSYMKASYGEDESIVIECPQYICDNYSFEGNFKVIPSYVVPLELTYYNGSPTYVPTSDMKYVLKKTANGYEPENPDVVLGLAAYGELADMKGNPIDKVGYAWLGEADLGVILEKISPDNGVMPPQDSDVEQWVFIDLGDSKRFVNVVLGDDKIYIQGLERDIPDAWLRATVTDGKVTIPSGSYIGISEVGRSYLDIWGTTLFEFFEDPDGPYISSFTDEVVFDYDEGAERLELMGGYITSSIPREKMITGNFYMNITIEKQHRNVNTLPKLPVNIGLRSSYDFDEPSQIFCSQDNLDDDHNLLDESKLYYTIYINGKPFEFTPEDYPELGLSEATINIPYNFSDEGKIISHEGIHHLYFNFDVSEKGCGVQSMYINEEGKELRSAILWCRGGSGMSSSVSPETVKERTFFNMQGQAVSPSYNGPVVCRTVYDNGTVKVTKLIRAK